MEVLDTVRIKNRNCYKIQVTARSTPFIETFYKVKDTTETYIDMEYGFSWKFVKRTREGGYYRDLDVEYDHLNQQAYIKEIRYKDEKATIIQKKKEYSVEIEPFVHDILSSFYFVRTRKIEPGRTLFVKNNSRKKNYLLDVLVNPLQKLKIGLGTFKAIQLYPKIKGESIFNQKGAMKIWVTNDERHLPLKMQSKVKIGSVDVELIKIY
jgi:hypothetical protein